jgi:[acyl-carrier-protein] S-malonyltransferase
MAALLGIELDGAQEACKEAAQGEVVAVANDNGGGQVVVSGHKGAVERTIEAAKPRGAKRGMLLPVSAPFHCPLMQPAADAMQGALAEVVIRPLAVPVLANVTAAPTAEPETVRRLLVEQVTGRVRWRESILALKGQGVETTVEMGGNKILTGMVKRIDKDLQSVTLDTPDEIEAFAKVL